MSARKDRINAILQKLNEGLYEREEIIAVSFLAALCGEHAFLLGPPGTAKSLIARRISQAFETDKYFEILMNRFSTPEDVFGPVSIKELKEDNYVRKTEGYLPEADFAFLDEIWKSSPAILNTLLTIVNERKFHNGAYGVLSVPLKSIVSASNETPPPNQGLEALYDRFAVRLHVDPAKKWENIVQMLEATADSKVNLPAELKIKNEELKVWQEGIAKIILSKDTLKIVEMLKTEESLAHVYVSDRLWQKATKLMKAAAFFCERKETNLADTLLLRHCLWSSDDNRESVVECVETAVKGFDFGASDSAQKSDDLDKDKDELEREVKEELYYGSDDYETVLIAGKDHFKFRVKTQSDRDGADFYVLASNIRTTDEFHPVDADGEEIDDFTCDFKGGKECEISGNYHTRFLSNNQWVSSVTISPKSLEGRKPNVNHRLIKALREQAEEHIRNNEKIVKSIKAKILAVSESEMKTPFIPEEDIEGTVLDGVRKQQRVVEERIEALKKTESLL